MTRVTEAFLYFRQYLSEEAANQGNHHFHLRRKIQGLTLRRILLYLLLIAMVPAANAFHPISSREDIISVYPVYPEIDFNSTSNPEAIRRGEYLAKIGDCIACHSNPSSRTPPFAGGLPIATPFGTFYSPNITPDKSTGIGNWTEENFIRAMHDGIRANGSNAFPAFPYVYFNRISKKDLQDLWAYLRAIPAVKLKNKGNTLPFIMNWRSLQYGWKSLYFYPDEGFFKQDPEKTAAWNRGAYLVNGLGHCTMCHTPMNAIGGEQKKYFLTGALIEGYWAPDITGSGLETASKYQVAEVFADGLLLGKAGPVRGPMADVNHDSLQHLTEYDRLAIAEYLKSVVSRQPRKIPDMQAKQPLMKRGQQVYANVCIMCHLDGQAGAPRIGDQADWQQRIMQNGLPGLYRHAINGYNKMPIKGACLNCNTLDLTAAVNYLVYRSLEHSQWNELNNPATKLRKDSTSLATGKAVYEQSCVTCHGTGKLGAPVTGDREQWSPLLRKDFEVLVGNTLKGFNNMPAKGGCAQCTNSEVIAAVKYILQQSQTNKDYSLW